MIKGTTPTHEFTLPFFTDSIKKLRILYSQDGTVLLTKTETDCKLEDNVVKVRLTQQDTFLFDQSKHLEIQMRVLTTMGTALTSVVMKVSCYQCLENEVLQ